MGQTLQCFDVDDVWLRSVSEIIIVVFLLLRPLFCACIRNNSFCSRRADKAGSVAFGCIPGGFPEILDVEGQVYETRHGRLKQERF